QPEVDEPDGECCSDQQPHHGLDQAHRVSPRRAADCIAAPAPETSAPAAHRGSSPRGRRRWAQGEGIQEVKAGQGPVSPGGPTRMLAGCALTIIAGLQIVGVVSSTVIRHLIQTLPLWIVLWLGFRGSKWTRWAAFPVFAFWLALMAVAWGFLLGWTRIISGTFSPTEIAMTLVTGAAAGHRLVAAHRDPPPAAPRRAHRLRHQAPR